MTALDLFGYLGSVLVAISLMMSNIKRLRWINLVGAGVFSTYGYLIGATPVFILNGWIVLVDIYYLARIYKFRDDFELIELSSVQTPLFTMLMKRYGKDIVQFFPDATMNAMVTATPILIFRNMKPVGLFIYKRLEDDPAIIEAIVDYVIPEERDFKTAQFLFNRHSDYLREKEINTVVSHSTRPSHIDYLKRIGFEKKDDGYFLYLS